MRLNMTDELNHPMPEMNAIVGHLTRDTARRESCCSSQSACSASGYKLTVEEMQEAEAVMEEMGNDPDAIAYELVWRRHHMPNSPLCVKKEGNQ